MSVFYEMKVHICGIIFVLDGPRDGVRRGQLGGVIDEGLDDCNLRYLRDQIMAVNDRTYV